MEVEQFYIGEAFIPRGIVALDTQGRDFMIKRDITMPITKAEDGELTFEHDGQYYFVKAHQVVFKKHEKPIEILPESNEVSKANNLPTVEAKAHDKGEKLTETTGIEFAYKDYMHKSLGRKREEMPQFDPETLADVLVHFASKVKVVKVKRKLSSLKPTQDEINEDKILERIKSKYDGWKDREYIISLDGHILDGHHDWAHGLDIDPETEVDCWRISLPIKMLLANANKLKVAKKKDIEGNEIEKGKHMGIVTVHGKNKTFDRHQMLGHKDEPKNTNSKAHLKDSPLNQAKKRLSLKPKVEHAKRERTPQWYDKYTEKHGKMRGLPIGMGEHEVQINHGAKDPHAEWLMKYKDKKGVSKTVYTEEFMRRNAEKKWARIKNITPAQVKLVKTQPIKLLYKEGMDETSKQSLAVIAIIANTGLRPGSRVGFLKTKNRGVSTLHPDNVQIKGDTINFDFIGKSYQQNVSTIKDKKLADYLTKLKKERKGEQFLFSVNKAQLMDAFREKLGFKGLKLKDLRTYVATDKAKNLLYESDLPPLPLTDNPKKNKQNLQKKLMDVFEKVSQTLNNTPMMAKNSYIHPAVIHQHVLDLGMSNDDLKKGEDEETKNIPTLSEIISNSDYPTDDHELGADDEEDDELDFVYPLPEWWDDELLDEEVD